MKDPPSPLPIMRVYAAEEDEGKEKLMSPEATTQQGLSMKAVVISGSPGLKHRGTQPAGFKGLVG